MITKFKKVLTIALAAIALTTASLAATTQANACPGGYFSCGGACCPR